MQMPEEEQADALRKQADALRKVAELGEARAEALATAKRLQEPLRDAALEAVRAGALRSRVHKMARIAPHTLYNWMEEAGLSIRPHRRRGQETAP